MVYLIAVSVLWAFSFGLIKVGLTDLNSTGVATVRLLLALIAFLPFLRPGKLPYPGVIGFMAIGAVQFGLMYALYIAAFQYLQAHEVVMFTIFTPIYVVLLDGVLSRRIDRPALGAAALALAGAAVLKWEAGVSDAVVAGFLLMQGSNLCFAAGQIAYRRFQSNWTRIPDVQLFAWLYIGAVAAAGLISLQTCDWSNFVPSGPQWAALIYLGILASGLGFFGWNLGATKVNVGTLAVFNNLKIPLAVFIALAVFGEYAPPLRLGMSLALMMGALYLTERR